MGKPDPQGMRPESVLDSLFGNSQVEEFGRLIMNPEIFEEAPPWAIEIMNGFRRMANEVASHNLVLVRRGLITVEELMEARLTIQKMVDEKFKEVITGLNRGLAQTPNVPPSSQSSDPRTSPR